ncbi:MAG: hypothetical protein KJ070_09725 [Verrucomicrobia bacterium]|nr:hypothetical protein [Verrucomicrobiota bacterium]
MNSFWLVIVFVLALAALFVSYDRLLLPWRNRKTLEKTLHDVRAGKLKPSHFDATLHVGEMGFEIRRERAPEPSMRMAWNEIVKVTAYKRDRFNTDLICVFLSREGGTGVEVHEEMNGWVDFIFSLPRHLPGCKRAESWVHDIASPAFEPKVTELFSRPSDGAGRDPGK